MRRPRNPPQINDLMKSLAPERLSAVVSATSMWTDALSQAGRYRHWEKLRYLQPPKGLSHEEWWLAIKLARNGVARRLPLTDPSGRPFSYVVTDQALALLHFVDQFVGGSITIDELVVGDEMARRRYLVNSVIEESIRSSQLEGASTTRRVAKEMILSQRPPRDQSERMIMNNYFAMEFVREHAQAQLTPDMVKTLQRIVTEGTLEDPATAGRFQTPDEHRVAVVSAQDEILHNPPPAEQLAERVEAMCAFANQRNDKEHFTHPVIKAILLHFWLAYDHPFVDGNGRTARALFYWSMKHDGYWLAEYLSISSIIRRAPARYGRSFLYTETDGLDCTYFILNQLAVIKSAVEELTEYIKRKVDEVRRLENSILQSDRFNGRQLALLKHASQSAVARYSVASHSRAHHISEQSARNDLKALEVAGFIVRRDGRPIVWSPVSNLPEKLRGEV